MQIGAQLKDSQIVENLVDKIRRLDCQGKDLRLESSNDILPFMFLEGSSGMGKTQMAFTLMNRRDLKVHYLVCTNLGPTSQTIYKRYENLSQQFLECVDLDCSKNANISFRLESEACGFIVSLVTGRKMFRPMNIAEGSDRIKSYLKNKGDQSPTDILFLDEFPHLTEDNLQFLRWMRNICRRLHLVTICSSTSSSVANLVTISKSSRESGESFLWCYVFPRFPKVLNGGHDNLSAFKKYLINNSRPLFSRIFVNALDEGKNEDISQLLGSVGAKIHELKRKKFGLNFAHGQICLLLAMFHKKYKSKDKDSAGVFSNSHFANLVEDNPFCLVLESECIKKEYTEGDWNPCLSFPDPREDILLFLCLMGNKGYYPICKSESTTRIPFVRSLDEIEAGGKLDSRSLVLRFENPAALYNSGVEWEATISAIISLCSHYEGLNGIEFGKYISHVLYELEFLGSSSEIVSCKNGLYSAFSKTTIPFLSAPSVSWPEELLQFNVDYNLCNLRRSRNSDRIDFQTDPFTCLDGKKRIMSGECKNWRKKIETSHIEDILVRVPENSAIHLVFVKKMQEDYYDKKSNGKTFHAFAEENPNIKNKLILRFKEIIENDRESKQFVEINGIPMDELSEVDGIVLFISTD